MAKQKRYSMAFRERAVRRMKLGVNVSKQGGPRTGSRSNLSLRVEAQAGEASVPASRRTRSWIGGCGSPKFCCRSPKLLCLRISTLRRQA